MAIDYCLYLDTPVPPDQVMGRLGRLAGFHVHPGYIAAPGLTIYMHAADKDDRDSALRRFGIAPRLLLRFSWDKRHDVEDYEATVVRVTGALLREASGDAALDFEGEDALLERRGGKLRLNEEPGFWRPELRHLLTIYQLPADTALELRRQLWQARYAALDDAENFDQVLFAIERLGCVLTKKAGTLSKYKDMLVALANESSTAGALLGERGCGPLFDLVKQGRNDALHQGAFARHLAQHATEFALILEDALMADRSLVEDFMVPNPICAKLWQPLALVRQAMLAHDFSYLPIRALAEDGKKKWMLVSAQKLAVTLRERDRNEMLAKTVAEAVEQEPQLLLSTQEIRKDMTSRDAARMCQENGRPLLVTKEFEGESELLGIVTPFDLL